VIGYECDPMGRRAAFLGLAVFLVLILLTSMTLATTLDGCRDIMTRVVCEPGATLVVPPA
jgi:hypothetical protein